MENSCGYSSWFAFRSPNAALFVPLWTSSLPSLLSVTSLGSACCCCCCLWTETSEVVKHIDCKRVSLGDLVLLYLPITLWSLSGKQSKTTIGQTCCNLKSHKVMNTGSVIQEIVLKLLLMSETLSLNAAFQMLLYQCYLASDNPHHRPDR